MEPLCPAEVMNVYKVLLIVPAFDLAGENDTDEKKDVEEQKESEEK